MNGIRENGYPRGPVLPAVARPKNAGVGVAAERVLVT